MKVLLVQVDVKEPHHALRQLMRIAILCDLTLMLAWSHQEAGQILETYKVSILLNGLWQDEKKYM